MVQWHLSGRQRMNCQSKSATGMRSVNGSLLWSRSYRTIATCWAPSAFNGNAALPATRPSTDSLGGSIYLGLVNLQAERRWTQVGGATGCIGDPSGRSTERKMMETSALDENVKHLTGQLERIFLQGPSQDYFAKHSHQPAVGFKAKPPIIRNNMEWTRDVKLIDFLQQIGKHANLLTMLGRDR